MSVMAAIALGQKLQPGDHIRLICEQEPTLSVERVLSPDGFVELPLLGRILLAGRFVPEAEQELERLAMAKLHADQILIAITLVKDRTGPIEFAGAVTRSGSAPFKAGMTLDDIVKLAEPVGAELTEIEITASDGKKVTVNLDDGGAAVLLHPGDSVFFPRTQGPTDVLILGGVARPGSKTFYPGMTLADLVKIGGGVTAHGIGSKIRLERKGETPRTIDFEAGSADVKLQRGDIVTVPVVDNPRYVTVAGLVPKPGLIDFKDGMTLRQAINAAGGVSMFGNGEAVVVKRIGQWKHTYSLARMAGGKEPELVLMPGDIIEVPPGKLKPVSTEKPEPRIKPKAGPVVPPL